MFKTTFFMHRERKRVYSVEGEALYGTYTEYGILVKMAAFPLAGRVNNGDQ